MQQVVKISNLEVGNQLPITLFAGINVLESKQLALQVCEALQQITSKHGVGLVFKASFDKANRSSLTSFRGPGLEQGLVWLQEVKQTFGVPILTDVHQPNQAKLVAQVADVIQLPAFLSRQTDLVEAMAKTGAVINIKKAQFLSPAEINHIVKKFVNFGNNNLMLCERGTMFGYNNLVVDMLSFPIMQSLGYPVLFDVSHALQQPGALANSTGGRRQYVDNLTRAGVSQGIAGLFLEVHPDPAKAKCDGPCALPLAKFEQLLVQINAIDQLVKSFDGLQIND